MIDGSHPAARSGCAAPAPVKAWLEDAGRHFRLHLFSNNPSQRRISAVAEQLGVSFTCSARKPHRAALRRVVAELDLPPQRIAMLGDRVFTDVLGGNRLGLFTVLVRPIASDGGPVAVMGCSGWNAPWRAGWGLQRHDLVGGEAGYKPAAGGYRRRD